MQTVELDINDQVLTVLLAIIFLINYVIPLKTSFFDLHIVSQFYLKKGKKYTLCIPPYSVTRPRPLLCMCGRSRYISKIAWIETGAAILGAMICGYGKDWKAWIK